MKRSHVFVFVFVSLIAAWTSAAQAETIKGRVFWDRNQNGIQDRREPGIEGVVVSNGMEVTATNRWGQYALHAYDEMIVFVSKPAGYDVPLDDNNLPQFYYIHQPNGSPDYIQEFPGIDPTGPLPESIDFPLIKTKTRRFDNPHRFNAVMIGDTQVYDDDEISYLRDSLVKELAGETRAAFALAMGDNIGDVLSLYPRYLSVMSGMGVPFYLVPGNHDMNFDAEEPQYAFETFKRYLGPTYYSFNYGKVHFVVLNSVVYPSPLYPDSYTYHGEISEDQMEWLANDLAMVPMDHLIVLNMHIPVVSYQDRTAEKHQVANREALYELLEGRPALALGGHTHTLEHFLPGEEEEGWGQPTPIPQIIVGAACGSWWTGDPDETGVPTAYQRDGAPRGFSLFEFNGNRYEDTYKATGKSAGRQMNISFDTPSFNAWYDEMWAWIVDESENRPEEPPVTIDDLPDQGTIQVSEIGETMLVANVWNASAESDVYCAFDGWSSTLATRTKENGDPYALRLQSYVFRYATGFTLWADAEYGPADPQPLDSWLHTQTSPHLWHCEVPADLASGIHQARVITNDIHGNWYQDSISFEVVE